jgi:hypothetical protein
MKTRMNVKGLGMALALLGLTAASARAAGVGNPSYLLIDVTITNNLSVSVSGFNKSTQTITWNGEATLAATSTATVTNDAGYVSERWELTTTPTSWDSVSGATGWVIGATQAADQVKLQAVFGASGIANSACTGATLFGDSTVAPALLNGVQTQYTQTVLADSIVGAGGVVARPDNAGTNRMLAGRERALCWQMTMPTSTSFVGTQVVPIVVTAF